MRNVKRSSSVSELVLASLSVSVIAISSPEFHSVPASITMLVVLNPMPDVAVLSYVTENDSPLWASSEVLMFASSLSRPRL